MQITTTKLTRAAGLAAVAAGALFIAVQVKHPEITLDFVQSTQWTVRQGMKVAMAVARARRDHRDVPAPGAPDRPPRAGRLPRCSAWAT